RGASCALHSSQLFFMTRRRPRSTLFPYTTLFRSRAARGRPRRATSRPGLAPCRGADSVSARARPGPDAGLSGLLAKPDGSRAARSEEHTSELQSRENLVCRLLLEKKKINRY